MPTLSSPMSTLKVISSRNLTLCPTRRTMSSLMPCFSSFPKHATIGISFPKRESMTSVTVHCKLDRVGHRSLCPPRNGTGVVLLEAGMCRVSLKEMSGSSYLSPYSKMSKIVQLLFSCCIPSYTREHFQSLSSHLPTRTGLVCGSPTWTSGIRQGIVDCERLPLQLPAIPSSCGVSAQSGNCMSAYRAFDVNQGEKAKLPRTPGPVRAMLQAEERGGMRVKAIHRRSGFSGLAINRNTGPQLEGCLASIFLIHSFPSMLARRYPLVG